MRVLRWRPQLVLPFAVANPRQGEVLSPDWCREFITVTEAASRFPDWVWIVAHLKKFDTIGAINLLFATRVEGNNNKVTIRPDEVTCFPTHEAAIMWLLTKHSN